MTEGATTPVSGTVVFPADGTVIPSQPHEISPAYSEAMVGFDPTNQRWVSPPPNGTGFLVISEKKPGRGDALMIGDPLGCNFWAHVVPAPKPTT